MTRNLQLAAAVVAALLLASPVIAGDNELSDEEKQAG